MRRRRRWEAAAPASPAAPTTELLGGSRESFGTTHALRRTYLFFDLRPGEAHALPGENGAGKSDGAQQDHDGSLSGGPRRDPVQRAARRAAQLRRCTAEGHRGYLSGAAAVPGSVDRREHFHRPSRPRRVDFWRRMFARAEEILASIGVTLDVHSSAGGLTLAT